MARLTISQEEYDRLSLLTKDELLAFIREHLLAKRSGRPAKPNPLTPADRSKRYRENKRKSREIQSKKASKKHLD